jgi:hypothetical protein
MPSQVISAGTLRIVPVEQRYDKVKNPDIRVLTSSQSRNFPIWENYDGRHRLLQSSHSQKCQSPATQSVTNASCKRSAKRGKTLV